jgi:hypothetical protein
LKTLQQRVTPAPGVAMSAFEFYFSFYGLLLGLCVAQIANGIGHAVVVRRESRFGWLTPLLAAFVLFDIASFWLNAWVARDAIRVSQLWVYSGLFVALCYYVSAVMLFPVRETAWENLDEHYWLNKRWVASGVGVANAITFGYAVASGALQGWTLQHFLLVLLMYWAPLGLLIASKSKWVDALCLALLIGTYVYGTSVEAISLF